MDQTILMFREYFEYRDGQLFWKKTAGTRGIKGQQAGKLRKDGYYDVGLKGKYYLVHRVIFGLFNDYLPPFVDHVNHNPADNRIENLRASCHNTNIWNSRRRIQNSSGVKGVRLTKNGRFEARVAVFGVTKQVGTFSTLEQATAAIATAREALHGEFTCHG